MSASPTPTPAKPLPEITGENAPFWNGAREGVLRLQCCDACGHLRHPIQPLCPRCLSPVFAWTALSGRGEVFATAVYHRAFHPAYRDDTPYAVALVQLEEGPRMFSDVVDCAVEDVRVGLPLEVVFDRVTDDVTVPRFRPRPTTD